MRIQITPPGGSTIELTGTTPDSFCEGLGGTSDWLLQIVKPINAPQAQFEDRGNVINTRTFRVHRTWPNPQTAEAFFLTHPDACPHIAAVSFLVLDQRGAIVSRCGMSQAAIKVDPEAWKGVSTTMRYHITGGIIS